jgi:putative ATPase
MVIFAAEDIGNADPRALGVACDALRAFELVGLPEGVLPMTQAAIFLASCPKSNSTLTTYSNARAAVTEHGPLPVPLKLRNAPTPLMKSMGYSGGYRYPHNFSGNYVPEEYLPDELRGQRYYRPSQSGEEAQIGQRLEQWREEVARKRDEEEAERAAGERAADALSKEK